MHKRLKSRRSPIWALPLDQFKAIVASSDSLSDILRQCGISPKGHNSLTLKKRLKEDAIDYSHIMLGRGALFKRGGVGYRPKPKTLEDCMITVFIPNHEGSKGSVRKYLRKYHLIEEKCAHCSLINEWNGKHLTLQLEHINGDSTDDRLENLCWLCPNCHSQTDTYTGKANKNRITAKIFKLPISSQADIEISHKRNGHKKGPRPEYHKVTHPSKIELETLIWKKPVTEIAILYGVSSNSIKKWANNMNLQIPPYGYWQRRKAGKTHEEALTHYVSKSNNPRKFSNEQILDIRLKLSKGVRPSQLSRDYGCSHKTIRDIRDRLTYKEIL